MLQSVTKRVYCLYYVNGNECIGRTMDDEWVFVPVHLARTWADHDEAEREVAGLKRLARLRVGAACAEQFWWDVHGGVITVRPIDITFALTEARGGG